MGPIFNFTTDFNRVTKQDVSDVNSPPLREASEKVLFYLHPSSRVLSRIRDRLSFASRGLQHLPPRDRPSQQADRNDRILKQLCLHGSGCHAFRDLAGSSSFAPIKGSRPRYLCAPSHEKRLLPISPQFALWFRGLRRGAHTAMLSYAWLPLIKHTGLSLMAENCR